MKPQATRFLREAKGLLDEHRVYEEPWALEPAVSDFWPLRLWKLIHNTTEPPGAQLPIALLYPRDAEEIAQVIKLANAHGVGVRVVGAGSGVLGALSRPSPKPYAALDLSLIRNVDWVERESLIIKAGAGLVWSKLEQWLRSQGHTTGHYPQSMELASVGGLVAAGSSGSHSTGYGNIEDLFKGGVIVTGKGEVLDLPPTVREPLTPPLRRLLVGSEGLLAVLVEAYLQARPLPPCSPRQMLLAPGGLGQALGYMRELAQAPPSSVPAFLRAWDEFEAGLEGLTGGSWGAAVAFEYHVPCPLAEPVLGWALDRAREHGLEPLGESLLDAWMEGRLRVFEKIAKLVEQGLWFETMEMSATWSRIPRVYEGVREALTAMEGVVGATAHVGHAYPGGAVLYFTLLIESGKYPQVYDRVWEKASRVALERGAVPYHHHGWGRVRQGIAEMLVQPPWPVLVKALKRAWDPNHVLV